MWIGEFAEKVREKREPPVHLTWYGIAELCNSKSHPYYKENLFYLCCTFLKLTGFIILHIYEKIFYQMQNCENDLL